MSDQVTLVYLSHCLHNFVRHPLVFMLDQWETHPYHIILEVMFCLVMVYFYLIPTHKANKPVESAPTKEEERLMLADFQSEVFREENPSSNYEVEGEICPVTVVSRKGPHIMVLIGTSSSPKQVTDLATFDFHSFSTHSDIIAEAQKTVRAYGCGSCGPRGFYGTIKPHLDLEENLARFCGTEECMVYSFAYATISTLIPSYASRADSILMDSAVHVAVQQGCVLSRANLQHFRHLDYDHLEELMKEVLRKEKKSGSLNRYYVVTEGIFRSTGEMCNLQRIHELCKKYKFRIILDDSYGFGAMGSTGRGTPECFGLRISDIPIYVGSLCTSLGTIGGFCCGTHATIDHQRLTATGYVFSAALPPYATQGASAVVDMLRNDTSFVAALQRNARAFRRELRQRLSSVASKVFVVESRDDVSPVVHVRATSDYLSTRGSDSVESAFNDSINHLLTQGIVASRHLYNFQEKVDNAPSLRLTVKSLFTENESVQLASAVAAAVKASI